MRLGAYVFLLFSISVIFYFMGYTSILGYIFANQGSNPIVISDLLSQLVSAIVNQSGMLAIIGIAVGLTLLTGFSAMYIIPLLMLVVILNFFIFPLSFVFDSSMPAIFSMPLITFFNIMTVLAITSFIRGGSV